VKRPKKVITSHPLLRQLCAYEELLSQSTGSLPYRHQIQLNAIIEALAVLRGDGEIRQEDIDTIAFLSNQINCNFKGLLGKHMKPERERKIIWENT
jgi:hypothetical protein